MCGLKHRNGESMKYYECLLYNVNNGRRRTEYIPEKYAKVLKTLRVGEEDGWRVLQVSSEGVEETKVMMMTRFPVTHSKATDI